MRQGVRKDYLKGTRRHRWTSKYPTKKFLQSRLGRQWSDVHSELSQEFDRRTFAGYLFWKSLEDRYWRTGVATNCWVGAETGTIYHGDTEVCGFYVHPKTGLLSYEPEPVEQERPGKPLIHIALDETHAYEKIEGIWYYTTYQKNDYYNPYVYTSDYEKYEFYSKPYVIDSRNKRQISSKELRANNLTNDSPEQIREDKIKEEEKWRKARNFARLRREMELKALAAFSGAH